MSPWSSFTVVVQSVSYNSWWPHGLQHTRLLYPPLSPGVCSSSCPLSWWCYLTISSSAAPFSFCLQSFLASRSFATSKLFVSGAQSIGASASASDLPMNIQGWFPFGWTGLISLQSKGLSRVFSSTTIWEHQFFSVQPSSWFLTSIHDYGKNHSFDCEGSNPGSDTLALWRGQVTTSQRIVS